MKKKNNLLNYILKMQLTKKIIGFLGMVFLVNFIICLIIFQISFISSNKKEMLVYADRTAEQVKVSMNQYFKDVNYTAYSIIASNWMQELLNRHYDHNTADYQNRCDNAMYFLSTLSQVNGDMGIVVYGNNSTFISTDHLKYNSSYDITKETWYSSLLENRRYAQWGQNPDYLIKDSGSEYFSFYYVITDNFHFQNLGYLVLMIPREDIPLFSGLQNTGVILENIGKEQICNDMAMNLQDIIGNKEKQSENVLIMPDDDVNYVITAEQLEDYGWKMHIITSHMKQTLLGSRQTNILLLSLLSSGLLIVLTGLFFTEYLRKPIIKCKEAFSKMKESDNWGISIENKYHDELGELIGGFNDMSTEIAALAEQNRQSEQLRRAAELEMLLQQINPHFLYNTLEMISGLILEKKTKDAVTVCEQLGAMFRYNLSSNSVTEMKDEYNYINQYMTIAKYKIYSLEYYPYMEESLRHMKFQKFLLQPLIENSVKHGFKEKRDECCMEMSVTEEEGKVCIFIIDNGSGIPPEQLEKIESSFLKIRAGKGSNMGGHVGIENVYRRLWLEYGERMNFIILSREGFGTRIKIEIPKGETKQC